MTPEERRASERGSGDDALASSVIYDKDGNPVFAGESVNQNHTTEIEDAGTATDEGVVDHGPANGKHFKG